MCTLAAIALQPEKPDRPAAWAPPAERDAVREALHGGDGPSDILRQRVQVTDLARKFYYAAGKIGMSQFEATKVLVAGAREARDAVEGEWGHALGQGDAERWVRLSLPVGPNP